MEKQIKINKITEEIYPDSERVYLYSDLNNLNNLSNLNGTNIEIATGNNPDDLTVYERTVENKNNIILLQKEIDDLNIGGDAIFDTGQKVSDISLVGNDMRIDTSLTVDGKIASEALIREDNDTLLQTNINNEASIRENEDILINDYQTVQDNRIGTNEANITTLGEILATQNNVLELSTQVGIINEGVEIPVNFTTVKNSYPNTILTVDDTLNTITPLSTLSNQYIYIKINVGVTSTTKTVEIRFYQNNVLRSNEIKTIPVGSNELTLQLYDIDLFVNASYRVAIFSTVGGGSITVNSGLIYMEGPSTSGGFATSGGILNDKFDNPNTGINPDLNKIDLKADTTYVDNQLSLKADQSYVEIQDNVLDNRIDNLVLSMEALKLPIGTKLITGVNAAPFSYGVWNLIGKLFENETIIGFSDDSLKGTRTSGENKAHNHQTLKVEKVNSNEGGNTNGFGSMQYFDSNGAFQTWDVQSASGAYSPQFYTDINGTDKNLAAGLHIGQAYIWERIS